MFSCSRQSFSLPKKLFISRTNSSSKSFSVLSSRQVKPSFNIIFSKINYPKQIQCRYYSLNNTNSFFESIRYSEAAKLVTTALIETHDITGLPWSLTIILASAVMKLFISFPCGIYQQYLVAKLELTQVELEAAAKKIKETVTKKAYGGQWTKEKYQSEFLKEMRQMRSILIVKNNCHPFKITILFLTQLPFWLLLTVTIRSLALDSRKMENSMTALQFQVGGPFWCQNLSVPDPKFILPTITTLFMLISTEVALSSKFRDQYYKSFLRSKILPNFLRVFAVCFFFVSSASPAGVSLFWAASSALNLCQNLLLLSPRMRRVCKIPKTASEIDKPYSYTLNNFVQKFQKVFIQKK